MTLPPSPLLIEVAVETLEGAQTAHAAGADRLELSCALELGGLTPSLGTLIKVKDAVPLPIIAMLRPRPGGFIYSDSDFNTMQQDADLLLNHGADGLAFGFLTPQRSIDIPRIRALLSQIAPRQSVFHRAFDLTADPFATLETLVGLGITRILTSGRQATALAGADLIRRLIQQAGGRIEILPGGGINPGNVKALIAQTAPTQIHGSFSIPRIDPTQPICEGRVRMTSAQLIASIRVTQQGTFG